MRAKANPDDLVHEPGPFYLVSERTIEAIVDSARSDVMAGRDGMSIEDIMADLRQDNDIEVEVLTVEERAKIDLLQPPF